MNTKSWLLSVVMFVTTAVVGCSDTNPDPVETARPGSTGDQSEQLDAEAVSAGLPEQREPLISAAGNELTATPVSQQSAAPVAESQPTSDAFTKLCDAYANSNGDAWAEAEKELLALGREAEPTLVGALCTGATHERELAAMMLAQIGADSLDAKKALKAALKDESTFVQSNAVSALCACGDQSEEVMAALSSLLRQEETDGRVMGAMSAANLGGAAAELLPEIVALLSADEVEVRKAAAEAIGSIGTSDSDTLKQLKTLAGSDADESVRATATTAVAQLGGQPGSDADVVPAGATADSPEFDR